MNDLDCLREDHEYAQWSENDYRDAIAAMDESLAEQDSLIENLLSDLAVLHDVAPTEYEEAKTILGRATHDIYALVLRRNVEAARWCKATGRSRDEYEVSERDDI